MKNIKRYIINLLLAVDQILNTLLLGHPDETISSRLGRSIENERYEWVKRLRIGVDYVFDKLGDPEHCKNSVMPLEQENFRTMTDYEIWSWNESRED